MEKKLPGRLSSPEPGVQANKSTRRNKSNIQCKLSAKKLKMKSNDKFHHLSNIAQLTEQNDPQGKTVVLQNLNNQQENCITNENVSDNANQPKDINCFKKIVSNLLRNSLNCLVFTYKKIHKKVVSDQINIQQSQISELLSKLRKKKSRRLNLLPQLSPSQTKIRTLVLDLDETLIYSTFRMPQKYDFHVDIETKTGKVPLYIIKRFGVDSFIFQMSQLYELVIFSSSKDQYIQKIMEKLDPKKKIKYLFSRQHCIVINKSYYIKSIKDLGRNPQNVIVVDSHQISASLNPQNLYKIQCFKGSNKDRKLIKLGYFLKHLQQNKQIRQVIPVQMVRRQFESKQIRISQKLNKENKQNKKKEYPYKNKSKNEFPIERCQEQQTSSGFFDKN